MRHDEEAIVAINFGLSRYVILEKAREPGSAVELVRNLFKKAD